MEGKSSLLTDAVFISLIRTPPLEDMSSTNSRGLVGKRAGMLLMTHTIPTRKKKKMTPTAASCAVCVLYTAPDEGDDRGTRKLP